MLSPKTKQKRARLLLQQAKAHNPARLTLSGDPSRWIQITSDHSLHLTAPDYHAALGPIVSIEATVQPDNTVRLAISQPDETLEVEMPAEVALEMGLRLASAAKGLGKSPRRMFEDGRGVIHIADTPPDTDWWDRDDLPPDHHAPFIPARPSVLD